MSVVVGGVAANGVGVVATPATGMLVAGVVTPPTGMVDLRNINGKANARLQVTHTVAVTGRPFISLVITSTMEPPSLCAV